MKIMKPRAPKTAVIMIKMDDGSHQFGPIADKQFLINYTRKLGEGLGDDN